MKIKVMSFNLRVDGGGDGINNFSNRGEKIIRMIRSETADLIGFQEATDFIRSWLRDSLGDEYFVLGCGRNANYRGESVCIGFRRRMFELISFDTRFFSLEPQRPGSRHAWSDQSACPRMFVHAALSCEGAAGPIHFFNTHLDHRGDIAREVELAQLLQEVSICGGAFVLTGDFNAEPETAVASMPLRLHGRPVCEPTAELAETFHGYGTIHGCKIDYIYTDGHPVSAYAVEDPHPDGIYLSDHFPICAVIDFA